MAQFVVNLTLLAAVLVLLVVWGATSRGRRQRERRERLTERRAILAALTHAAEREPIPSPIQPGVPATPPPIGASPAQGSLDAESVAALLTLIDERRPARLGLLAGLMTSPRSVWSAGVRAGQNTARRTMAAESQATADSDECREADDQLTEVDQHYPVVSRQCTSP